MRSKVVRRRPAAHKKAPASWARNTRPKESGGYEMRRALECIWAIATLRPNVLTIAGVYNTTTYGYTARHGRTNDIVIVTKLNDFYLGVCISLVI